MVVGRLHFRHLLIAKSNVRDSRSIACVSRHLWKPSSAIDALDASLVSFRVLELV